MRLVNSYMKVKEFPKMNHTMSNMIKGIIIKNFKISFFR